MRLIITLSLLLSLQLPVHAKPFGKVIDYSVFWLTLPVRLPIDGIEQASFRWFMVKDKYNNKVMKDSGWSK